MALIPTSTTPTAPLVTQGTGWLIDSINYDMVPACGIQTSQDVVRSIGRQAGSSCPTSRALVNQMLPVGVYMVQTVPGAETNTFTARQSITGTLVNAGTIGDGVQTGGTFPAGALNVAGRVIRVSGGGTLGTTLTPTYTIDVALGANILATTGALVTVAVTSPANFWFTVTSTVLTTGATGTIMSNGIFNYHTATNVTKSWPMANSTPGTALSIDLTATQAVTVNATSDASSASNRFRLYNLIVEILA